MLEVTDLAKSFGLQTIFKNFALKYGLIKNNN